MKTVFWSMAKVLGTVLALFGLVQSKTITIETAVVTGCIMMVFVLSFESLRSDLSTMISPMGIALAEIQRFLHESFGFVPLFPIKADRYTQTKSPLRNTELGEKLLEESGAKKLVDDNYSSYEATMIGQNPTTALDVQTLASQIIGSIKDSEAIKPIKDFVYKNPKFHDTPLEFLSVQRVMSIYLRDLYLKERPELILPD